VDPNIRGILIAWIIVSLTLVQVDEPYDVCVTHIITGG